MTQTSTYLIDQHTKLLTYSQTNNDANDNILNSHKPMDSSLNFDIIPHTFKKKVMTRITPTNGVDEFSQTNILKLATYPQTK